MNNLLLKLKNNISTLDLKKDDLVLFRFGEKTKNKISIVINMKKQKIMNFSKIDLILKNGQILDIEFYIKKKLENYEKLKKKSLEKKPILEKKTNSEKKINKFFKEFNLFNLQDYSENDKKNFENLFENLKIKKSFRRRKKIKKKNK